jgi:predicted RecA/RadA family phage recombinase
VYDLKAKAADTGAVGAKVYWDNTAKEITTTASGNTPVGVLTEAKTNGPVLASVRLNGSFA